LFFLVYSGIVLYTGYVKDFSKDEFVILAGVILFHGLFSFLSFFRTTMSALGYFQSDRIFSILDRILMFILVGIFLVFLQDRLSIATFVWAQNSALIIAFLSCIYTLRKIIKLEKISFHKTASKEVSKLIKGGELIL